MHWYTYKSLLDTLGSAVEQLAVCLGRGVRHGAVRRTRFRNPVDLGGFLDFSLDFKVDFWISKWISGFQSGFLDFKWISGFQSGFLDFKRISGFQSGFLDFAISEDTAHEQS